MPCYFYLPEYGCLVVPATGMFWAVNLSRVWCHNVPYILEPCWCLLLEAFPNVLRSGPWSYCSNSSEQFLLCCFISLKRLENESTLAQTFAGRLTMTKPLVLLQLMEEGEELVGGACRKINGEYNEATVQNHVQKMSFFASFSSWIENKFIHHKCLIPITSYIYKPSLAILSLHS